MNARARGAALLLVMWLLVLLTGVVAVFALGARPQALQGRSLERMPIARYAGGAWVGVGVPPVAQAGWLAALGSRRR